MIKSLQRKFIFTAMAAVTVLLLLLTGGINAADCWISNRQTSRQLEMLADTEGHMMRQEKPQFKPESLFDPPMDEDAAMALRYFVVRLNAEGKVIHKDIDRIASVGEAEAEAFARQAAEEGRQAGYISGFKYRAVTMEEAFGRKAGGTVFVFLDVSGQLRSVLMVFVLTVSAAVICWLAMLLFVTVLSKRAILPIARNIQKQKQFVTDAGHEIKTPLAVIQSNIDAMELINGENKWSRNIRSQTIRLHGLMQDLLTLAKMDEEHPELSMDEICFSTLVQEALQPFYEPAALRGIRIETKIRQEVFIHADRACMQRLLSILLDNAVKYADENGMITITLQKPGHAAVLQVKNTCEQLPGDDADRLFDRFYRGDSARTQKNGGYGIGLSAAYAIAAAHHGSIRAEYADAHTVIFTVQI